VPEAITESVSPAGCDAIEPREPRPESAPPDLDAGAEAGDSAPDAAPPRAHCSQNAGDEQYVDPFANAGPPKAANGNGSQGPASQSQPPVGSAADQGAGSAAPSSLAAAAVTGRERDGGPQLPTTGLELGGLLGLGCPLLLLGLVLRRRFG
jgi:hypothetical protein